MKRRSALYHSLYLLVHVYTIYLPYLFLTLGLAENVHLRLSELTVKYLVRVLKIVFLSESMI